MCFPSQGGLENTHVVWGFVRFGSAGAASAELAFGKSARCVFYPSRGPGTAGAHVGRSGRPPLLAELELRGLLERRELAERDEHLRVVRPGLAAGLGHAQELHRERDLRRSAVVAAQAAVLLRLARAARHLRVRQQALQPRRVHFADLDGVVLRAVADRVLPFQQVRVAEAELELASRAELEVLVPQDVAPGDARVLRGKELAHVRGLERAAL